MQQTQDLLLLIDYQVSASLWYHISIILVFSTTLSSSIISLVHWHWCTRICLF
jgi:hypothetical protein